MKKKSEIHPIYQLQTPWKIASHTVWLASTVALNRNISKFKFPTKLDKERQQQVISLIYEGLKKCAELKNPVLFRSEEIGPLEKEFLLEHFLISDGFYQAHGGEGFLIDETGCFLGVINVRNHLQLELLDTEQEIEKTWNRLIKIEECVGKSVDFAFNPRFGFLTSSPSESGTGLSITLFLHIPGIIHSGELPELLEKEREEEIEITGLQGSATEMIGDILIAKNSCSLGISEEYIITSLRMWATRAVVAEVSIRKKLREGGNENIKNKVARSLGLLTHSYQLETVEALNALSLVILGIELGWISCSKNLNLYHVFFNCRRVHLLQLLEKKVEIPELPRKRSEYLHTIASQLSLAI
jgi:protein arginine kinase